MVEIQDVLEAIEQEYKENISSNEIFCSQEFSEDMEKMFSCR